MDRGKRFKQAREDWCRKHPESNSKHLIEQIVGISEPAYYRWESSPNANIRAENLLKFARATDYRATWLLWGKGPKKRLGSDWDEITEMLIEMDSTQMAEARDFIDYLRKRGPKPAA